MADLTRMDDGLENSSRAESLSDLISMETKMSELMDEEVSNRRRKAAERRNENAIGYQSIRENKSSIH